MLSSAPKIIAYLTSTSLELKGKGVETKEHLDLSKTILTNTKVVDEVALREEVITFLAKADVKKQPVVLLLGEDVTFQELVPFTTEDEVKKEVDSFLKKLPLAKENVSKVTLATDKEVYVIATNRMLYEIVSQSFVDRGFDIKAIVPFFLFKDIQEDTLLKGTGVEKILESKDVLDMGSFASGEDPVPAASASIPASPSLIAPMPTVPTKAGSKKQYLYVGIIVLLVAAILFVGFLTLKKMHLLPSSQAPTPVVTKTPTPTPTVAFLTKDQVKIQVLNGTGKAGQAKIVKDALTKLDYKTITTDNAADQTAKDTTVVFAKNVSKDMQDEIVGALKKSFQTVTLSTATDDNPAYNIVITTGT